MWHIQRQLLYGRSIPLQGSWQRKKERKKDCDGVVRGGKPKGIAKRCSLKGVSDTCRSTCSVDTECPSQSITVPSEVEFGSEIVVSFTNPGAVSTNWIGIYYADGDPADIESYVLFWSSMCGSQDDWNEDSCTAQTVGSVTFSDEVDLEEDEQWPASPGACKVCLMYDDYIPIICEHFTIKDDIPE